MSTSNLRNLAALFCGALFSAGLVISGMTQPAKVSGFLDFTGAWDASLMFVMGGAVTVVLISQLFVRRWKKPALAPAFPNLSGLKVDGRLLIGAAIFGVGWGLVGYCPGPALVALGSATGGALLFVPAMAVGILLSDLVSSPVPNAVEDGTGAPLENQPTTCA